MEKAVNEIVPEEWSENGFFDHTLEGKDDMPSHVKSALFGVSLSIPISSGSFNLGY